MTHEHHPGNEPGWCIACLRAHVREYIDDAPTVDKLEARVAEMLEQIKEMQTLIGDLDDYLEDVLQWYEGGPLPGEIRAKNLMQRLRPWQTAEPSSVEEKK